jgi:hypothetical protein
MLDILSVVGDRPNYLSDIQWLDVPQQRIIGRQTDVRQ